MNKSVILRFHAPAKEANEGVDVRDDTECMVLHYGTSANSREETLLHTSSESEDRDLG